MRIKAKRPCKQSALPSGRVYCTMRSKTSLLPKRSTRVNLVLIPMHGNAETIEAEIREANEKLIQSILQRDWATYKCVYG